LLKKYTKSAEEESQALKTLFLEVTELDFIPRTLWGKVAHLLKLKIAEKDTKLISNDEKINNCYIVLTGSLKINEEKLVPGNIFGELKLFNGKKWHHTDVIALENSSVAYFSSLEVAQLIDIENSNLSYKALIQFLIESIPKFDQLSGNLRDRLGRFFQEKTYVAGADIIKEGVIPNCAYLIKEGKCKIVSTKNPLAGFQQAEAVNLASVGQYVKGTVKIHRSAKKLQRGYMSMSTSMYQLRTIAEKEWFGEEILFDDYEWESMEYSVIAVVKTTVLSITKENLNKFPADVLEQIKRNARDKVQWQIERKKELSKSIIKINKMNSLIDYAFPDKNEEKITKKSRQILQTTNILTENQPAFQTEPIRGKSAELSKRKNLNETQQNVSFIIQNKTSANWRNTFDNDNFTNNNLALFSSFGGNNNGIISLGLPELNPNMNKTFYQGKRLLAAASTFRTINNKKMLCPTIIHHPLGVKKIVSGNTINYTKRDRLLSEMRKNIVNKQDTFMVGVKEVKAISSETRLRPPSPNPAKIWAERNGINLYARGNLNASYTNI